MYRRWSELDVTLLVVEGDLQRAIHHLADPAELINEVHVPGRSAELPVGRRLQSHLLLQRDDLANRLVLDPAELLVVDHPPGVALSRLQQLGRPQQAAHVICPKRGHGARGHGGRIPSNGPWKAQPCSSKARWATANAPFAAGTPAYTAVWMNTSAISC